MRSRFLIAFSTLMTVCLSVALIVAQGTCPDIVEQALSAVDNNCSDLGRNEACYGYDLVGASFLVPVADDFFIAPRDTTSILELETLSTTALDESAATWGVAVMNLQANVPNTLPGQNVTFLLFGDAEIENAVNPEDAFSPVDGLSVFVKTGANIRSGPGLNFNVIGGASVGGEFIADGRSTDNQWLRVVYRNRPAWINRTVLEENSEVESLPVLTPELRTAMQAFYLRTGIGRPACEEAPGDSLMVQGPEGVEIELSINGADIRIGSTVAFRNIAENVLEGIVLDGKMTIPGQGIDGDDIIIRQGYRTTFCLDEAQDRGLDGESNDRQVTCLTAPERVDLSEFCNLEGVLGSNLHYPINVPCPGDTPPAPQNQTTNNPSQLPDVDCSTFSRLPEGNVASTLHTFSWTAAAGATQYELVFIDYQGNALNGLFYTPNTSLLVNMGEVPTGGSFQWEVRAFRDGNYACVTTRSPIVPKLADPAGIPPSNPVQAAERNFSARLNCSSTNAGVVSWSGAFAEDTIFFDVYEGGFGDPAEFGTAGFQTYSGTGVSGSIHVSNYSGISKVIVRTSFDSRNTDIGNCSGSR